MLLLRTIVSVSHARQPISQKMGEMAKVMVTVVVEVVRWLALPLAASPLILGPDS